MTLDIKELNNSVYSPILQFFCAAGMHILPVTCFLTLVNLLLVVQSTARALVGRLEPSHMPHWISSHASLEQVSQQGRQEGMRKAEWGQRGTQLGKDGCRRGWIQQQWCMHFPLSEPLSRSCKISTLSTTNSPSLKILIIRSFLNGTKPKYIFKVFAFTEHCNWFSETVMGEEYPNDCRI